MIENDEQLKVAQKAVQNLQQVLLAARKVHNQGVSADVRPDSARTAAARTGNSGLPQSCRDGGSPGLGKVERQHLTKRWRLRFASSRSC